MIDIWSAIEADFQRDYGMNLSIELEHMSWRRFQALLNNLSPFGAVSVRMDELLKKPDEDVGEDEKRMQADGFFSSLASLRA